MRSLFGKSIVCAALLLLACSAYAQIGLEAGYSNSTHYFEMANESHHGSQSGFYIELDYAVGIIGGLKIAPGIRYNYLAGESKFPIKVEPDMSKADTRAQKKPVVVEQYLSIPIDVSYTFMLNHSFGLTAFVTPMLNCGLQSSLKYGTTSTNIYKTFEEVAGKKNAYSPVDFMLGLGLSADIASHFRVKFSYDFGLVDRLNIEGMNMNRNQLNVGLGFMF